MGKHLRRLFSAGEAKEIFERYLSQEIEVEQVLGLLKIRRRWQSLKSNVSGVSPRDEVELRVSFDLKCGMAPLSMTWPISGFGVETNL